MKNKKGFSLLEILAVIIIIGVISVIAVTAYNSIKTTVLESSLENLVLEIEIAANQYAYDTGITSVSVETLVLEGYITSDDDNNVINPVDNSSLLCQIVEINFIDGEYSSSLDLVSDESLIKEEDGSCINYITVEEGNIIVSCEDGSCIAYSSDEKTSWYSGEISLSLSEEIDVQNVKSYSWETNLGYYYSGEITDESPDIEKVVINNSGILNTIYTLTLKFNDGTIQKYTQEVNLDNEIPSYVSISKSEAWSNGSKNITINATDNTGSGVKYYYINKLDEDDSISDIDCEGLINKEKEEETPNLDNTESLAEGTYFVCIMDNVGNVSAATSFEVSNIDEESPLIQTTNNFSFGSYEKGNSYYSQLSRIVTFTDEDSGVATVKYCITTESECTPTTDANITKANEVSVTIDFENSNKDSQTICVLATDAVDNSTDVICDDSFKFDNTNPTVSLSQTDSAYLVEIEASDSESGIDSYSCYYGTKSTNLKTSGTIVEEDGNVYCQLDNITSGTTYYVEAEVVNGAGLSASSSESSNVIFSYTPEITLGDEYYSACGDNEYCSNVIFVSYNGTIFGIYRNTDDGFKALYQGTLYYMYESTDDHWCCDDSQCTEANASYDLSLISDYVDNLVATYSNYKNVLVRHDFCVAPVSSGVCSTTYSSYGGLLDYDEFGQISSLTTLFSHDNKTSIYIFLANRLLSSYTGLASYKYTGSSVDYGYEYSSKYTVHGYVKHVVVFDKSNVIVSGSGTYSSPYVIEV